MSDISTPADEAAMTAARVAIFGEDRKDGDFASGPWAIRPADLAKHMRAFAAAEYARGSEQKAVEIGRLNNLLDWCKMRLRPAYCNLFDKYRANPMPPRDPNEPPLVLSETAIDARLNAKTPPRP